MFRPNPTKHERNFDAKEIIVSKTDVHGHITYGNDLFIDLSGYSERELLGAPHNIIRHPDMPKIIFKLLWSYIKSGNEINAYVKNLSKDGSYYWVLANVTPSFDCENNIIGFYSVRRKPTGKAISTIDVLYKKLKEIENTGNIKKSEEYIQEFLEQEGKSYEEFILSI